MINIDSQTIRIIVWGYLGISAGSGMPNRKDYIFPQQIGLYIFDWFYATVKIITLNAMKELEKKGLPKIDMPQADVVTQQTTTVAVAKQEPPIA